MDNDEVCIYVPGIGGLLSSGLDMEVGTRSKLALLDPKATVFAYGTHDLYDDRLSTLQADFVDAYTVQRTSFAKWHRRTTVLCTGAACIPTFTALKTMDYETRPAGLVMISPIGFDLVTKRPVEKSKSYGRFNETDTCKYHQENEAHAQG